MRDNPAARRGGRGQQAMNMGNYSKETPRTAARGAWAMLAAAGLAVFVLGTTFWRAEIARPRQADAATPRAPQAARAPAAPVQATPAPAPDPEAQRRWLEAEGESATLRTENTALKTQLEDLLNWILVNFKGRYPLSDKHLDRLQLQAAGEDYTLDPDVAEFLSITPEETTRINEAFAFARAAMQRLEDETMQITVEAPDRAAVAVPPYPEEGAALRDDLYARMDAVMGADRFGRFLQVSQGALDERYHGFGQAARALLFSLEKAEGQELPLLKIRDEWTTADGDGKRSIRATEWLTSEVPDAYRDLLIKVLQTEGDPSP